jgi:hypothetical protein
MAEADASARLVSSEQACYQGQKVLIALDPGRGRCV